MATFRKRYRSKNRRRNTRRNIRRNTRRKYIKARKSRINRRSRKSLEGGLKFPSFSSFAPSFLTRRKVGIAPTDDSTPTIQDITNADGSTPTIQHDATLDGSTPTIQHDATLDGSTPTIQDKADANIRDTDRYNTNVFSHDILNILHSEARSKNLHDRSLKHFEKRNRERIQEESENKRYMALNGMDNNEW
jgi:hypothetical protein